MADFEQVVSHSLKYLRANSVVGENVIRDLHCKSRQLPCTQWMQHFKGAISMKTYREIHRLYVEETKHDCGFDRLDARQVAAIERFYDDIFSTG